jgi:hypothetical protein
VLHLLELARLRIWAHGWGIHEIRIEDRFAVFGYTSRDKLTRLVAKSVGRLRIADGQNAYLPLTDGGRDPVAVFADVKALLRPAARSS